jgi:hypothetical protein
MADRWLVDHLAEREAHDLEQLQTWAWAQLTWWERRLYRMVMARPALHRLLAFVYEARAIRRMGKAWGESCDVLDAQAAEAERMRAALAARQLLEEDPRTERSVVHFLPADLETPTPVRPRRRP